MASKTLYFDIIGRDKSGAAAIQKVGQELLLFGAAAGAAVGVAVKKFADFDAQMSQVKTLSHATSGEMAQLTDAALTMGQGIGFSATQVADAETELVKAGISVSNMMGGALKGALNLAAAGQIDVGQATEIATIALTQFNLKGKDVPHVADLLAAGADKALGGVADLGEALKSGGLVAAQYGVSLDQTVGTLAAFANAGLLGETAGTDLRQMLLKLGKPSAEAAKTMSDLGINIYDATGKFIGMDGLAGQLHDKMVKLDPATRNAAMATIFGAKAIAGANILYAEGAAGIQKWTDEVNDTGFAAEQARGKMDNLKGDVKKLEAAFDSALIKSGSGANDSLRMLVQSGTDVLKFVGDIPEPLLVAGLAITAAAAAAALLGGGFLVLVPKIEATRAAVRRLNAEMPGLAKGAGAAGMALRAVPFIVIGAEAANFTSKLVDSAREALGLAQSVDTLQKRMSKGLNTKSIDDQLNSTVLGVKTGVDQLSQLTNTGWLSGAIKSASQFTSTFEDWNPVFKAVAGGAGDVTKRVADLDKAMAQSVASGNAKQAAETWEYLKSKTDGSKEALGKLKDLFPQYAAAVKTAKDANDTASSATEKNATALSKLSNTASDAQTNISDLADQIKNFGQGQLDVNSANRQFQQSIDDVTTTLQQQKDAYEQAHGSMDGFQTTLDINTQEGRDNSAALDGIASSALNAASAILTQTGSQTDATAAVQQGRDALIAALGQFGITGQAAQEYADKLGLIPKNVTTAAQLTGTQNAQNEFDAFVRRNDGRVIHATVDITGRGTAFIPGIGNVAFASGGDTDMAPGPKGVDSMLAWVAKGEHVLPPEDVDAMGGQAGVYAFRQRLRSGARSKAAAIGTVSSTYTPMPIPVPVYAPGSSSSADGGVSSAPTVVNVRVTQKVAGVSLRDLIQMEIQTADGWQSLELESGVGR